ncbi:MAG: sugar phosphate isomerase/epimerase family protein [Vicinamibacterales bacterium]|nr:sugar phosphate isomerase/epimerase family protein [Vicinamibacterales bacterium]
MPPLFGVSTHLFHGERLDREHLVEVAAHGFDAVEVFATRTHFDYHDPAAVAALAEWLDDTRLTLHSMHAPVTAGFVNGVWGDTYSTAIADEARRERTVAEIRQVLEVAKVIPYSHLVVHLGVPLVQRPAANDNHVNAARRTLETLESLAAAAGVAVALEVIPNPLSTPETLVSLLEDALESRAFGICLDVGHAFLMGDVVDAVETCSGHITTTHLHDNDGRDDAHLVPWSGGIDWEAAVLALQKVGYDGAWIFEVAATAPPPTVLERTARAKARLERLLGLNDEMLNS